MVNAEPIIPFLKKDNPEKDLKKKFQENPISTTKIILLEILQKDFRDQILAIPFTQTILGKDPYSNITDILQNDDHKEILKKINLAEILTKESQHPYSQTAVILKLLVEKNLLREVLSFSELEQLLRQEISPHTLYPEREKNIHEFLTFCEKESRVQKWHNHFKTAYQNAGIREKGFVNKTFTLEK